MKKIVTVLLVFLLITLCGCSNNSIGNVKIMTISDLHYLSPTLHDDGEIFNYVLNNSDGKTFNYSEEILDTLIETTIKENPDVLVITGDISFNGAKVSNEELASALKEIEDNGIDVLVMSGNHDINSPSLNYFGENYERVENVDPETFATIYADYGYNENYLMDDASNSFIYKANNGLWLLCLDVNYDIECCISEDTLDWVEEVLKQAQKEKAYVISFSHQNILQHNPMFDFGYVIIHHEELLELYKEYGVQINFAGHLHIQDIKQDEDFYEVLTSSTSITENHYGIIEVNDNQLTYQTYDLDIEGYAKEKNITDENLLNYNEYAKNLFLQVNSGKATSSLTDEQKQLMSLVNLYYFTGKLDELDVQESDFPENSAFLNTIKSKLGQNDNHLEISINK